MWARVQPVLVSVGEISKTHDPATFTDGSFIEAANQYNVEELQADVAEWIANNKDRYDAMAK
jgi:hypothetical protein